MKKIEIILTAILTPLFIIIVLGIASMDNPKIYAKIVGQSIVFKESEVINFEEIENIILYEEVTIDIRANGYRWENGEYYSGDANVKILDKDENEIVNIKKAKTYIDKNVNACIYIEARNKKYIFNLKTIEDTKTLFSRIYVNN